MARCTSTEFDACLQAALRRPEPQRERALRGLLKTCEYRVKDAEAIPAPALARSWANDAQRVRDALRMHPACKGTNCDCTDGYSHSPECRAEHAALAPPSEPEQAR